MPKVTKRLSLVSLPLAILLVIPVSLSAGSYTDIPESFSFQKNMSIGVTLDPDVRFLQLLLNADPRTIVSKEGAGSNSNPTAYFGAKTQDAVMRFQQLYSSEVLAPANLSKPTGIVGAYTRAKLNSVLKSIRSALPNTNFPVLPAQNQAQNQTQNQNQNRVIQITNQPPTNNVVQLNNNLSTGLYSIKTDNGDKIYTLSPEQLARATSTLINISSFSKYKASIGENVTLYGSGFHQYGDIVFLGQIHVSALGNVSGTQLTFTIPYYMPTGYYHLAVSNRNGTATSKDLVLTITQRAPGTYQNTTATTTSNSSATTQTTNSSDSTDSSENNKLMADPILDLKRRLNPIVKLLTDDYVSDKSISSTLTGSDGPTSMFGGGNSGSSGGGGASGIGAGIGAIGGGSSGGGSTSGGTSVLHFGGTITQSTVCVCNSNPLDTYLSISDVNGNTVQALYQPGISSLRSSYNIWTAGVYTIGGLTNGGGSCMVGVSPYCSSAGTAQYNIDFPRGIGTGAVPAGI